MHESARPQHASPIGDTRAPGHIGFQIARALRTQADHADPATRDRAGVKLARWQAVLDGMAGGALTVGARAPVRDAPAWATLDVLQGGFATGQLRAGGPMRDHERALCEELGLPAPADFRALLNGYFLSDDGLARLDGMLRSACYDIDVPEEGALLLVAWLVRHGHVAPAHRLLDELAPWFATLRFYPAATERARPGGARVHLCSVGGVVAQLRAIAPNRRIARQNDTILLRLPLYDRVVDLFLATVDGPPPDIRSDADGRWTDAATGKFHVTGGWPCRRYPDGWRTDALALLDAYAAIQAKSRRAEQRERDKDSLGQLIDQLRRCADAPEALSGRDVGRIRLLLARYVAKRGVPGTARCREARDRQGRQAAGASHDTLRQIAVTRLGRYAADDGLDDADAALLPVTPDEARHWRVDAGTALPPSLRRKVERASAAPLDELVERGIVASAEVLARLLPQMTSSIKAAGIADPGLRHLYGAIYRAFRRRRSLLLLNLERQVQFEELPWVRALEQLRAKTLPAKELAHQTLRELATLTISSFPHTIIPNKLVSELQALSAAAGADLPLVEELAADIFMNAFSDKFGHAACRAAELLDGTLYARYYDIDYPALCALLGAKAGRRFWFGKDKPRTDAFAAHCRDRARIAATTRSVAANGMVIEQQQILTSHNLAVLVSGLALSDDLAARLPALAMHCFTWICRRQQIRNDDRHARLIVMKNCAYAWRQMVFYLALADTAALPAFLDWADAHLARQGPQFRQRFAPALAGLRTAADARDADQPAASPRHPRPFLGWCEGKHWLMA